MSEHDRNEAVTPHTVNSPLLSAPSCELEVVLEYKKLVLIEDDCERRLEQAKGTVDICRQRFLIAKQNRVAFEVKLRKALLLTKL